MNKRRKMIIGIIMIGLWVGLAGSELPLSAKEAKMVKVKKIITMKTASFMRHGDSLKIVVDVKPKWADKEMIYHVNSMYGSISKEGVLKTKREAVGKNIEVTITAKNNTKIKQNVHIRVLPKINPNRKMVALTFDDGVNAKSTNDVLNTLEKNDAVATFFIIGSTLGTKENKAALLRSYQMGNEIGNHTLSHANLTKLSLSKIRREMAMADRNIMRVTGKKPFICRPPYGATSSQESKNVKKPQIIWSIDSLDWQHKNPVKTYEKVVNNVHNGSIVLMHDMYMTTAEAVRKIVPILRKKGYQFVTVPELYAYQGKKLVAGKVYRGR